MVNKYYRIVKNGLGEIYIESSSGIGCAIFGGWENYGQYENLEDAKCHILSLRTSEKKRIDEEKKRRAITIIDDGIDTFAE